MFSDGGDFEEIFETEAGKVRVFAEVHIFGDHLILDELLFFPESEEDQLPIGVKHALGIFRSIRSRAMAAGFAKITVTYHRVGQGREGRIIIRTRDLL